MNTVTPEITVISSGYENQYGHPHDEVLERYGEMGIEAYWTGVHSDTVLTTGGDEIDTEMAEEFSTDPDNLLEETPDVEDVDESHRVSPAAPHITGTPSRRMMDGTYTGRVDRIVDGRTAAILLEDDEGDDVIAQLSIDVMELPEKAHVEGAILRVTAENGEYAEARYAEETEHRRESAQKRLGRLSKQLSDSS